MQEVSTNNNRLVLLLIAGIPVTMILVASWLWYFVARGDLDIVGMLGTANRGSLVEPPRALDDKGLVYADGSAFAFADLEPDWTFVVPIEQACDANCEQALYLTRQIHIAMGKEFNRIQRIVVADRGIDALPWQAPALSDEHPLPRDLNEYLQREQVGLTALQAQPAVFAGLFSEFSSDPSTWYLVDPAGWVMMTYNSGHSYKDIMADLKFLLKNSSE